VKRRKREKELGGGSGGGGGENQFQVRWGREKYGRQGRWGGGNKFLILF